MDPKSPAPPEPKRKNRSWILLVVAFGLMPFGIRIFFPVLILCAFVGGFLAYVWLCRIILTYSVVAVVWLLKAIISYFWPEWDNY